MVKTYKVGSHISKEADLVLEEQLLLSPGLWGGVKFTPEEIIKGIDRTDWNNPESSSILGYHPGKGELPSSEAWIGDMKNVRYLTLDDGVDVEGMYGDAHLYDPVFAKKIAYGGAKLAFSIDSPYANSRYGAINLSFSRTALVYRAGCKDAYIQLSDSEESPKMRFVSANLNAQLEGEVTDESSQGNDGTEDSNQETKKVELEDDLTKKKLYLEEGEIMTTTIDNNHSHKWVSGDEYTSIDNNHRHIIDEENMVALESKGHTHRLLLNEDYGSEEEIYLEAVTAMEEKRKGMGLSVSEFYAAPRDPPSSSALPIFDEAHVRNALSRFNQTKFTSDSEKSKARGKILSKAKTHGIDTSNFEERVKLSNSDIVKKGDKKRVMQKKTSNSSVQLDEAPVAAPKEEVTTPKIQPTEPKAPEVEEKVVTPEPKPEPAKPVQEEVQPAKEIVDNSKQIGELKDKLGNFESKITELTTAVLELAKPKEAPKEEVKTEPEEAPKEEAKTEPIKTEEVKKPALPQAVARVEDNSQDDSHLTPFEKAHARINSKK